MQDKTSQHTKPTSKVSQSVLHRGAALPLPHAPTNRTPTPPNTRASRLRAGYHGPARSQSPRCPRPPPPHLHPPAPARRRPPPWVQAQEAATAIPLRPAPTPPSTGSAAPPLPAGPRGGDAPAPSPPLSPHSSPSRTSTPLSPQASRAMEVPAAAASSGPSTRPS